MIAWVRQGMTIHLFWPRRSPNAAATNNLLFESIANFRDENTRNWVLDLLPAGHAWGRGRDNRWEVVCGGVKTAGQLRDIPLKQARGIVTVVLECVIAEPAGVPALAVERQSDGARAGRKPRIRARKTGR